MLAVRHTPGLIGAPVGVADAVSGTVARPHPPITFEVNRGQTDPSVRFLSHAGGSSLFLTPTEAVMVLSKPSGAARAPGAPPALPDQISGSVIRMRPVGANPAPAITGIDPLAATSNYFLGNDPARWQSRVANFGGVKYADLFPGVDMVFHGGPGGMEYDFNLAPGADPHAIALNFRGADSIHIARDGALVVSAAGGDVIQRKPSIYQDFGGTRHAVTGAFSITAGTTVGFSVGPHDPTRALTIDPLLAYSTYLGGGGGGGFNPDGAGAGFAIAVDSAGSAYVTGRTTSPFFPTTTGAFSTTYPGVFTRGAYSTSAYVTKLTPDGSGLLFSTFLGGLGSGFTNGDVGFGIAVDSAGNAYVTGRTNSTNFPTQSPFQSSNSDPGGGNAFVTKLRADGAALIYSTYLGGSGNGEQGSAIALDPSGNASVTGTTRSVDFPTTATAFQPACPGACFADGQSTTSSVTFTSATAAFTSNDVGNVIAGQNILPGTTVSSVESATSLTMSAAASATGSGLKFNLPARLVQSAFVTQLNPAGSGTIYSSYVGGSGFGTQGSGIAVDRASPAKIYLTGNTSSTDFPTKNPIQAYGGGSANAYVTKIDPSGTGGASLVYSTWLGGSGGDGEDNGIPAASIAVDPSGNAYITGHTTSTDFPISGGAFQSTCPSISGGVGCSAAFVTKLNAAGTGKTYSTYLGGSSSGDDTYAALSSGSADGIAVDGAGHAFVTGVTRSADFPAVSPLSSYGPGMYNGQPEPHAFVAELLPDGTAPMFSTVLGGQGAEQGSSVALDSGGSAYVTGSTYSADFPTTAGSFQTTPPPGYVGFVAKISPVAAGTPLVTGVAPNGGSTTGGTAVTLTGNGFAGATAVRFGGVSATFSFVSPTQITTVSPPQPAGTGTVFVTVTTSVGTSPANPIDRFFYGEGTWAATASLSTVRFGHTATLLPNGKVLVAGGSTSDVFGPALASAEVFDPVAASWTSAPSMTTARFGHTATLLSNGKVLVAGGTADGRNPISSAEIYDPIAGTWAPTGALDACAVSSASCVGRYSHTATVLISGKVLVTGSKVNSSTRANNTGEVYDPTAGTWSPVTNTMSVVRARHTATLLANGQVLVAGGFPGPTSTADIYDPGTNTFSFTGAMNAPRYAHTATLLPSGKVLVIGGADANGFGINSAELFSPAGGTWTVAGITSASRENNVASLLANGKVMVAGGLAATLSGTTRSSELFDPVSGTSSFFSSGLMNVQRGSSLRGLSGASFTSTRLSGPNCGSNCGKVLVVGGSGDASAELYTQLDRSLAAVVGGDSAVYAKRDALSFQPLGGGLLGAPAVVSVPSPLGVSTPVYVAVGGDHQLYVRNEVTSWQLLVPAGSGCIDNAAATVTPNGLGGNTLTVACQGMDHALYAVQTGVSALTLPSVSTPFQALGGALLSGPAVASVNGTLTYFAEGTDHMIYSRTGAAGNPYTGIGAGCIGHPAVASLGTDAYFGCQGLDGALYYAKNHNGAGWGAFRSAGGQLIDGPGIAATSTGVTMYVEGVDQALYHTVVSLDGMSSSAYTGDGGILKFGAAGVGLRAAP